MENINEMLSPLINISYINQEWLKRLLENHYGNVLDLSYQYSCPSTKEGFLSEISYVNVEFQVLKGEEQTNIKESLVFKFFPRGEAKLEFMKKGCLAQREVDFYNFAISKEFKKVKDSASLSMILPNALCSLIDSSRLTIVMQDLRNLNYQTVIPEDGSSFGQTKVVLSSIAVIHAAGLHYQEIHGKFPLKKYEDTTFFELVLEDNLKRLTGIFEDDTVLFNIFHRLQSFVKEIIMSMSRNVFFETIIHGDLWAGQCMFSESEIEACILDWQFANIGNPVIDLMAMFCMSSCPDILKNNLEDLLSHYWHVLITCLQKHQVNFEKSYCQFKENIENNWMIGFFVLAASLHDFLGVNISDKRLKDLMNFMYEKQVFNKFLSEQENKSGATEVRS